VETTRLTVPRQFRQKTYSVVFELWFSNVTNNRCQCNRLFSTIELTLLENSSPRPRLTRTNSQMA